MKYRRILIALILLAGCGHPPIEEELAEARQMMQLFKNEAAERGQDIDVDSVEIAFKEDLSRYTAGRSIGVGVIEINLRTFWYRRHAKRVNGRRDL